MENQNTKLLWKLQVPSKSEPGSHHIVEIYTSGDMRCDCYACRMGNVCNHMRKTRDRIDELADTINEKYPEGDYPTNTGKIKKVIPTGEPPKY